MGALFFAMSYYQLMLTNTIKVTYRMIDYLTRERIIIGEASFVLKQLLPHFFFDSFIVIHVIMV